MKIEREHVSTLARTLLAQRYQDRKPTPSFHEELWELCCSKHRKVAIAAPRGCAKSTAITHAYVLTAVLFRERRYVCILSDTEGQAVEFLGEIKMELKENDELLQMFGVKKIIRDTQTDIIVQFEDGELFRIIGRGAEQKIRGKKWRGTRPDLFVVDDLENDELVYNDDRRSKLIKWFYQSVLPAGSDNSLFRVIGTILHYDSLLERLMPKENDKYTERSDLKVWNTHGIWASFKYRAHNEDFSKLLWEEKLSKEELLKIKADYTAQGNPEGYSQEYLNEPIAEDNAFFKKGYLLPMSDDDRRLRKRYYAAGDLAISAKDGAAFTVFAIAGVDENNKLQVVEIRRGRIDALEIVDEILSVHEKYQPEIFWLEDENIQKSIGPVLNREMFLRNVFPGIELVTPSLDKLKRARPLQHRMKAGGVLFDKEAEWYFELEKEIRRFPKGPYKDQVDALGMIAAGIDQTIEPATSQELSDEEYEREFTDYSHIGRDMVTGY